MSISNRGCRRRRRRGGGGVFGQLFRARNKRAKVEKASREVHLSWETQ